MEAKRPTTPRTLRLDVIKKLPKAELHLHLDGSVRTSTLLELAEEQLPADTEAELEKIVSVDLDCRSLVEYLRCFDVTLLVLQKSYAITRIVYEIAEDCVADGIRYVEIRFSPILHTREGLSLSAVMEAVYEGKFMAEYHLSIKVNVIICGLRHLPASVTKSLAEIAWRFSDRGVVAFDLAGPEKGFSSKLHKEAFDLLRRKSVNLTLHSGEAAGWESVQDSIQWCGAQRLGHGVTLQQNPDLVQFIADCGVAVEVCVTSNLQTKAIKSVKEHPFRKYFDSGIMVVPCTDNPKVSRITLSSEYALIQENFHLNVEEMVRLIDYGFAASFLSYSDKKRVRAEALKSCFETLQGEGYPVSDIVSEKSYYDLIGVDLHGLLDPKPKPHWDLTKLNPAITLELCKKMPKTDIHCNLDGGFDINFLYSELNRQEMRDILKETHDFSFTTKEDLLVQLKKDRVMGKLIMQSILQTKDQIQKALENIYFNANAENVRYMEIAVRPDTYSRESLTSEEALQIILAHVKKLNKEYEKRVLAGVVVYVSSTSDDPVTFYTQAQLAVKYNDQVVGFGVYGASDIEDMKYYIRTFDYLKANNMKVSITCGIDGFESIIGALSVGGARRISGAFNLHKHPRLWDYLANHSIPIEISLTPKLLKSTKDISSYMNPVGFLIDKNIPVHVCTFRGIYSVSRSEQLFDIVTKCKLSVANVIKLLTFGFLANFQHQQQKKQLFIAFKTEIEALLEANNYAHFYKLHYFLNSK